MNGNGYRRKILDAAVRTGRGHLGGSFSCVEILMAISQVMKKEDDFVLSKGHAGIALYSILFDNIDNFCVDGSLLAEHPSSLIPEIKLTTGSLGHGVGLASGIALAKKLNNEPGLVYVLVGDGECMEGSIYEAIMFASIRRLNNLVIILDFNKIMSTDDLPDVAYGYDKIFGTICRGTEFIDGHDLEALKRTLTKKHLGIRPRFIVANTVKGKGVSFMENSHEWHHGVPKGEQLEIARKELSND